MTQHEMIILLEEMNDDVMETMVKHEGSIQIINLLIKNQADNIVFRELSNFEWEIGCDMLQQRNEIFLNY
jgi:hypothetical protein